MTEKRFGIGKIEYENDYDIWYVDKICDNGRILSDDEIVELLNALHEENEQLKNEIKDLNDVLARYEEKYQEENQQLKQNKHFFKIFDDYYITYDGDTFNMHKPSDIRSLVYLINRKQGYSELQCEYNDEEMEG